MSTGTRSGALSQLRGAEGGLAGSASGPRLSRLSCGSDHPWPSRLDLAVTTGRNSRGKVWFDTENRKWDNPPCCQMTSACTPSVLFQKDTHRREGTLGTSRAPPSLCWVCQDSDAHCRFRGHHSGPGPLSKASRVRHGLLRAQGFPLALLMSPGPPLTVPSCASRAAHTASTRSPAWPLRRW